MNKDDLWAGLAFLALMVVGGIIYALLPDREIQESAYLEIAHQVSVCPRAQSALNAANKDHKILGSEARNFKRIVAVYIKQDEKSTKKQNIQVAKGLVRGPLRKRSCLPMPEEPKKKP